MTRQEAIELISDVFSTEPDCPFEKDIVSVVFRHRVSRKWFALLMDIPANSLGLEDRERISIINLKLPASMMEDARRETGIYPAYHMNKRHWISVDLREMDGKKLKTLVDISFHASAGKKDL